MAKRQYNRTYYYSIGGMLTDEEVHQIWEIVGNALDRNGFVDADGSIFISERGDPRVTIVASGNNGLAHCEELQKMIGCGRLVSDGKLAKNTIKPVHRLIFSSKNDIREILKGVLPHLKLKSLQAKAVLNYIEEKDTMRKTELYQLVTYNNWKEHKNKAASLLDKWGLNADTIGTYAEGL